MSEFQDEQRDDAEEVEGHARPRPARPRPMTDDLDAEVEGHARPRPMSDDDLDAEVEGHMRPRP